MHSLETRAPKVDPMLPDRFPVALTALLDEITCLPPERGVVAALQSAARLVEYAAYEMARGDTADQVARLILLAAELERRSEGLNQAR